PYLRLLSIVIRHSTRSTLFPYTTLFRSSSGTYRFFISADDEAQFVFSTTASSADAQVVASVPRYSSRNQFDKYSSQASPIFNLRSEEHTSELQSRENLVCRLLREKKNLQ